MAFLKIDKNRVNRKGAIFLAEIDGSKLVVGRSISTSGTSILLKLAADYIEKARVPAIQIVKFRKSPNTYTDEALLHSHLYDYLDKSGLWYNVTKDILNQIWKDIRD